MGNLLKKKLDKKQIVLGPFLKLSSPTIVEVAAIAGFDYVIIDCEHGPLDIHSAQNMIRAAHLYDMSAVIRVGDNNPYMISRALDIGADAVQIPQISTKLDAINAVRASKFFPMGNRGICRYVRAAQYSSIDKKEYFRSANNNLVIIHIEGMEGIKNLDEILEVDGIDIIFIGPYDLSQSLNIPGDINNPVVEEKMLDIIHKARARKKTVGTFVDDVDSANKWRSLGVQYISYSVDVGIIYNAFRDINRLCKRTSNY